MSGNEEKRQATGKEVLQKQIIQLAFVNLFLVALLGLLLRSFPFLEQFPLAFRNVLHGHSHFAFGGWVLPVLVGLVMKYFPEIKKQVAFRHWRNITVLVFVSAYGMLLFFPFYGYKGIPIFFSTLSIVATTYLSIVIWKVSSPAGFVTSRRFLTWGLVYGTISAIGPFSTVPLIINGQQGSNFYFDLIYFYLHFQYNGFFTFLVLAVLFRWLEKKGMAKNGRTIFYLMNLACVPAYALSVLWHQPGIAWNIVGGMASVVQLVGAVYLWNGVRGRIKNTHFVLRLSFFFFSLKLLLQAAGSFPFVATMAYENRNFVIAYLHLALLGFVSLFVFGAIATEAKNRYFKTGVFLFLFSFVCTEVILVLQATFAVLGFAFFYTAELLFFFSLCFPVGSLLLFFAVRRGSVDMKRTGKRVFSFSHSLLAFSHQRKG